MDIQFMQKKWPFKWWGYWYYKGCEIPFDIDGTKVADPNWAPSDIDKIVEYLKNAPLAIGKLAPSRACGLCGEMIFTSGEQSDDEWIWPAGTWHFVAKHHHFIPDSFIEHIRARNFELPQKLTKPFQEMVPK
ncbi:MAG: hypothetical protein IPK50_01850 [Fibrobacterota bacterium]|nr:MAG: hypothetical protein IPK50_01850 [Fibrobacterota bacterium]